MPDLALKSETAPSMVLHNALFAYHYLMPYRVWQLPATSATPAAVTDAAKAPTAAAAVLPGHENNVCVLGLSAEKCVTGSTGFVHEGQLMGQQLRWWRVAEADTSAATVGSTGGGGSGGSGASGSK